MKELRINPSGLLGLVMKIEEELREGKSQDDILSEYPISKTSLPYLLTLVRETSVLIKEYGEVESKYLSLKEQIKRLESKKDSHKGLDSQELLNELERLKNENLALNNEIEFLRDTIPELEYKLSLYEGFFSSNSICAMFYKNYLKKLKK